MDLVHDARHVREQRRRSAPPNFILHLVVEPARLLQRLFGPRLVAWLGAVEFRVVGFGVWGLGLGAGCAPRVKAAVCALRVWGLDEDLGGLGFEDFGVWRCLWGLGVRG